MIGTLALVVWFYRLGILNDSNALKDFVHRHQFWGPLIFVLVQIFQVVFPIIPGGVTTVAGFLIFDPWLGFCTIILELSLEVLSSSCSSVSMEENLFCYLLMKKLFTNTKQDLKQRDLRHFLSFVCCHRYLLLMYW